MATVVERDDDAFEDRLGLVLRAGVVLAAIVVGLGGTIYLTRHGHEVPAFGVFHGEPGDLRSIAGIVAAARSLSSRAIIQLGLLLLIATPVARVVFALVGFARQKDWMYVGVSVIVLALLAYSLTGG
jgi:uncharacterized membrane protein